MQSQTRHTGVKENFTVELTLEQWPETNLWIPQHVKEKKKGRELQMEGTAYVKTQRCHPAQHIPGTAKSRIILDYIWGLVRKEAWKEKIAKSFACLENNVDFILLLLEKVEGFFD